MKEIYKNPLLYYIAVPALLVIWPLSVRFVYLPNTEKAKTEDQKQIENGEQLMLDILDLNPEREKTTAAKDVNDQFDFVKAVAQIASLTNLDSRDYTAGSSTPMTRNKRKTQAGTVTIKKIDIETFAKFITNLQKRWGSLECESVNISAIKGFKDSWKITIKLIYYY